MLLIYLSCPLFQEVTRGCLSTKMKQEMGKGKDSQGRGNSQDDGKITSESEVPRPGLVGGWGWDWAPEEGLSVKVRATDTDTGLRVGWAPIPGTWRSKQAQKGHHTSPGEDQREKAPEGKRL